ncbi:MAG TPA: NHL repeat-containing protein [Thermoanaerobaculia bacterium]
MSKRTAKLVFAMFAVLLLAVPAFGELQRQMIVKSWERLQTLTDGSRLAHPIGISHDKFGNIIAADTGNGRVVKLSRGGELLLAFGSPGSGPGQLHLPADAVVDDAGFFYVADTINNRISKFSPEGKFLLSWGGLGELGAPHGVAVAPDGSVYVADTLNHRVAKYTPDGKLLMRWGSEGSRPGELRFPHGITVDSAGDVFVSDFLNHRVVKFTADGTFVRAWGKRGDKPGEFAHPWGIETDASGNIWVTDMSNNRLQRISPNGEVAVVGHYGNTQRTKFDTPRIRSNYVAEEPVYDDGDYTEMDNAKDSTVVTASQASTTAIKSGDPGSGTRRVNRPNDELSVFVGHSGGFSIDKLQIDAKQTRMVDKPDTEALRADASRLDLTVANRVSQLKWNARAAQGISANAREAVSLGSLRYPISARANSHYTYVADTGNHRIVVLAADGTVVRTWGKFGAGRGEFNLPSDLALDAQNNVYVADTMNNRVQKFSPDGELLAVWGSSTETRGSHGIAVGPDNAVYVADTMGHRIVKYDSSGKFLKAWGEQGAGKGQIRFPHGMAVSGGYLYVADFLNHRIVRFTTEGDYVSEWGKFGKSPGEFRHPWGVGIDPRGDVWIGDMTNSRLQRFTPSGALVGVFGSHGNGLGQFDHPKGVDVSRGGEIVVGIPGLHSVDTLRASNDTVAAKPGTVATGSKSGTKKR